MFNFSNALFVGPSLFSFLPFVALAECRCSVRLCKRIENSDVEVGLLAISSPEVCCNNIEAGAFFSKTVTSHIMYCTDLRSTCIYSTYNTRGMSNMKLKGGPHGAWAGACRTSSASQRGYTCRGSFLVCVVCMHDVLVNE